MVLNKLKEYAAKSGVPEEQIVDEYKQIVKQLKSKGQSEEAASHLAMMRMRSNVINDLRDNSEFFEGIVLSPGAKNAYMESKYGFAKRTYESDPEQAIEEGLTNDKGEPLDNREFFNSGKPNPDYNKVITEIDYGSWRGQKLNYTDMGGQDVIGLCKKVNGDEIRKFKMTLFDGYGKLPIEIGQPIKFKAKFVKEENGTYILNPSSKTDLTQIIDKEPFNVAQEIENGVMGELIPLENMLEWYNENKGRYNATFITQGMVQSLNLNGKKNNIVNLNDTGMDLSDNLEDELQYKVWLPKNTKIPFGAGSLVYIYGGRKFWHTEDNILNMQEAGIYAPIDFRVDFEEIDEMNDLLEENFDDDVDFEGDMI